MNIIEERFGLPKKGQSKHTKRYILLFILSIILIALVTFSVQNIIQSSNGNLKGSNDYSATCDSLEISNDSNATLISYWDGIIGAIVSGILSFFGVFITIEYYRDADNKKYRVEHLPFLFANITTNPTKSYSKQNEIVYEIPAQSKEKSNPVFINIEFKNIGRDFAYLLVVRTGENFGGTALNKVINVNESINLVFKVYDLMIGEEISFALKYIDSMTNEYIQSYTISGNSNKPEITSNYPYFLEQTHDIGSK